MSIRYRSFAGKTLNSHGVSIRSDNDFYSLGITLAVGGRRAMVSCLSPQLARAIAAELIAQADRLEQLSDKTSSYSVKQIET